MTLDRLFALETFGIKLGLENISRLCEALGHPERSFRTIHVAGTNGKGSVTAMVQAALVAGGLRAGRYTSPHLTDITERFVIGDAPADTESVERVAEQVLNLADDLRARGVMTVPPTFFEATTALAFELFRRARVEVAVIEVGLGGRFDATNVITPVAGAVTTISLDHQQHLGRTLGAIAFEKAGIIKHDMTVVTGDLPAEALDVIGRVAAERGARMLRAADEAAIESEMQDGRARVRIQTPTRTYGPVTLALRGEHQVGNALVAVRLLEAAAAGGIAVTADAVGRGLASTMWPGRLEMLELKGGRQVLLDAAHNPEGAQALADYIRRWLGERPALVMSVMRDKPAHDILTPLLPVVSSIVATAAPTPRAIAPAELAATAATVRDLTPGASDVAITVVEDHVEAVAYAMRQARVTCVAGSIFLMGPVRECLLGRAMLP